MSHIVPIAKVNQFLPNQKLELDESIAFQSTYPVDHPLIEDLEETARDIVISKLAYRIDTSNWFGTVTPPELITNVMGMLVAGWVYDRQFAEESTEGSTYGKHKEAEAYRIIEGILSGEYKLVGGIYIDDSDRLPSMYDTDPVMTMGAQF